MPARHRRKHRRQLPDIAIRWLLGERTFWGLIPHQGWPFSEDDLRKFWHEHRAWALAECGRLGLPEPWQEDAYANPQKD